jgi:hypothetical protein
MLLHFKLTLISWDGFMLFQNHNINSDIQTDGLYERFDQVKQIVENMWLSKMSDAMIIHSWSQIKWKNELKLNKEVGDIHW